MAIYVSVRLGKGWMQYLIRFILQIPDRLFTCEPKKIQKWKKLQLLAGFAKTVELSKNEYPF
tara:strand:+ start:1846 stop:2031 length:186 start_codon:yes stop_codon:yes gene_type:complete